MNQPAVNVAATTELENGVCHVGGTLNFVTAVDALKAVSAHIKSNQQLVIDMSRVSESNSVGLALMIEWLAIARSENHTVTFDQIPSSLRQLAGVCQVDGLI